MAVTPARRGNPATDIALIAAFAALIAACALLPAFPIAAGVPFTLQTFAVVLTGAVLGAKRGFLAALLYLAVGLIGIPVFAGASAGPGPFVGATGGYLISFPFAAATAGFIASRLPRKNIASSAGILLLATLAGVIVNHLGGIIGLWLLAGMSLYEATFVDVFWPMDAVKALLAAVVATAVHRAFPNLLPRRRAAKPAAEAAPAHA